MAAADVAGCGKFSALAVRLADIGYWILPKPVDLGCLAFDALGAADALPPDPGARRRAVAGAFGADVAVLHRLRPDRRRAAIREDGLLSERAASSEHGGFVANN